MTSPNELTTVTLRVTSPCEHGTDHEFLELPLGMTFTTPKCVDSRGRHRRHEVTAELYPTTVRRR